MALGIVHLLIGISQKRDVLQEGIQRGTGMFFVEFADGVHHFVQVSATLVGSQLVFFPQEFLIIQVLDNLFNKNRQRSLPCRNQRLPRIDQVHKRLELCRGTACAGSFRNKHIPESPASHAD